MSVRCLKPVEDLRGIEAGSGRRGRLKEFMVVFIIIICVYWTFIELLFRYSIFNMINENRFNDSFVTR